MFREDVSFSGIGGIVQALGVNDLLLFTQETPDGFQSGTSTVGDFIQYILDNHSEILTGDLSSYLQKVWIPSSGSGLSGLGTSGNPLSVDRTALALTFATVSQLNGLLSAVSKISSGSGLIGSGTAGDPLGVSFDALDLRYVLLSAYNTYKDSVATSFNGVNDALTALQVTGDVTTVDPPFGWIKLPNGFIFQWGKINLYDGDFVTFPIVFPNKCVNLQMTDSAGPHSGGQDGLYNWGFSFTYLYAPGNFNAMWLALGF